MSPLQIRRTKPVPVTLLVANVAALGTLVPVALHQLGKLKHLPDPPWELFDSDELTMSRMAHPLGIPDALPGLASYGATLTLAILARGNGTARRLLAWKLVGDGAFAAFNTVRSLKRFGKLCSWCVGTAVCTVVMVAAGRGAIAREAKRVG